MKAIENIKLVYVLIAGLVAELCFELYAWLVSPIFFGKTLEPSNLVIALSNKFLNIQLSYGVAFVIHFLVGSIVFSSFVYLVHKLTRTSLLVTGLISGVSLWFVAQGILAPVIGRSFMMGFGAYTQSSFVGHVGMTLIVVGIIKLLMDRELSKSS